MMMIDDYDDFLSNIFAVSMMVYFFHLWGLDGEVEYILGPIFLLFSQSWRSGIYIFLACHFILFRECMNAITILKRKKESKFKFICLLFIKS